MASKPSLIILDNASEAISEWLIERSNDLASSGVKSSKEMLFTSIDEPVLKSAAR